MYFTYFIILISWNHANRNILYKISLTIFRLQINENINISLFYVMIKMHSHWVVCSHLKRHLASHSVHQEIGRGQTQMRSIHHSPPGSPRRNHHRVALLAHLPETLRLHATEEMRWSIRPVRKICVENCFKLSNLAIYAAIIAGKMETFKYDFRGNL